MCYLLKRAQPGSNLAGAVAYIPWVLYNPQPSSVHPQLLQIWAHKLTYISKTDIDSICWHYQIPCALWFFTCCLVHYSDENRQPLLTDEYYLQLMTTHDYDEIYISMKAIKEMTSKDAELSYIDNTHACIQIPTFRNRTIWFWLTGARVLKRCGTLSQRRTFEWRRTRLPGCRKHSLRRAWTKQTCTALGTALVDTHVDT